MSTRIYSTLALVFACVMVSSASAATVSPTKANGDFIPGTGIPADNFTISAPVPSGESLALKGRLRDTGQALAQSGNVYTVSTGLASDNVNPAWSVDWQFSPIAGSAPGDYWIESFLDFDPGVGATSFVHLGPTHVSAASGGYAANPGPGLWSDDTIPFVLADSFHLGFAIWSFLPGYLTYDPDAPGEYEFQFNVYTNNNGAQGPLLAGNSIFVNVVPEPAAFILAALAAIGFVGVRRWRM